MLINWAKHNFKTLRANVLREKKKYKAYVHTEKYKLVWKQNNYTFCPRYCQWFYFQIMANEMHKWTCQFYI